MGAAEELEALRSAGRLKQVPADVAEVERLLAQAEANLRTVSDILGRSDNPNPGAAAMLLWDGAAFRLLAAALQLAGYRVTGALGHHRTALDAVRLISGQGGLLIRLDALRRLRDQTMYDGSEPDAADIEKGISDVEELAGWTRAAVKRAAKP